jgi:hypothetical protein
MKSSCFHCSAPYICTDTALLPSLPSRLEDCIGKGLDIQVWVAKSVYWFLCVCQTSDMSAVVSHMTSSEELTGNAEGQSKAGS